MSGDTRYHLAQSEIVSDGFRAIVAQAKAEQRLPIFTRASRWIIEELARTPNEFGESREYLPDAEIAMRCGFARPVYVEFGVHEESRTVFLRRFELLPRTAEENNPSG